MRPRGGVSQAYMCSRTLIAAWPCQLQDSDDYGDGDYYYADEDYPSEEEEPEQPQLSADAEVMYSAQQPVYGRCKKVVDMEGFSALIAKTCGNIHEYSNVAYPCLQAMQQESDRMGCCWETVMDGYHVLYPEAYQAWRMWQGTLRCVV